MEGGPARELRVAVCGVNGWFCQRAHLPAWQRLEKRRDLGFRVRVVAAFCRAGDATARAQKRLGAWGAALRWYSEFDALLADADVDLIDLVMPIPVQLAMVARALCAGKSVCSEKPLCDSRAALDVAASLAAEAAVAMPPRAWSVLENWACKPGVLRVRELLESGAIGRPRGYAWELSRDVGRAEQLGWRQPGAYQGYFLLDVGVHLFRAARTCFGEVRAVDAAELVGGGACGRARLWHERWRDDGGGDDGGGDDGARQVRGEVRWAFGAGAVARALLRVEGTRGSLEWDADGAVVRLWAADGSERGAHRLEADGWVAGGVREALADAVCRTAHVRGLVAHCTAPHRTSPSQALRDARVVFATLRSAADGGARVETGEVRAAFGRGVRTTDAMGTWSELVDFAVECETEADVESALERARALGGGARARAVGGGHSWAEPTAVAAGGPAVRLRTRALDGFELLGPLPAGQGVVVRVGAGALLGSVVRLLRARELCLPALPMYLDVTAAGAASTGAHGSSLRHGSFSDSVVAVRLVAAGGGRAQWLREAQSECGRSDWRAEELAQGTAPLATLPDALAAARVGCGALGVVCALELCAVPLYRVRRRASRLPLLASREAAANLVAHARAHEHAWAHWRLGEADALVTVLEREPTDEGSPAAACAEGRAPALGEAPGAEGAPAEFEPYDGANWFRKGGGAALPAEPSAAATAEATVDAAPRAAAPVWISSEYGVPVSRMHEAACALDRALARSHRGQLIELKFVAAGAAARESLLGPNGGAREDICCFNVWWHSTAQPPQLAALPFERAMQALGATPHWGKLHTLPDGYVDRVLGERARRFRAVARALDPARMCAPGWC